MPLDARKVAHINALVPKTWSGRTRTVVFVYLSAGVYTYVATSVIMRPEQVVDLQVFDAGGNQPAQNADMLMIAPLSTNFTGVVFVADTTVATAVGVAAAPKYEIIEALPVGVEAGGSHIRVMLRRLR